MTEKRFEDFGLLFLDGFIRDNLTNEVIDSETLTVKLLNDLSEENIHLKKENVYLNKKNDNLVNMIARVQCRADTIKEKNKQLEKYFDIPIDDGKSMSIKELLEEYNKLKAQLYCDDDEGVCIICKHHYVEKGNVFYISKCEKGHEECSKEDLRHCKDFEVKELENG